MLTIERFRSEEMQNLYQQYLVSGTGRIREGSVQKYGNKKSRRESS